MAPTIQAITFDFGGVLLKWDPRNLYRRFFPNQTQAMEEFLAEINFSEWNLQQDKGRSFTEGVAELSARFPHYANLISAYYQNWEESIHGPIPGTIEILQRLKLAGYPLYGLSNWSAETFSIARTKYPFFNLFVDIIISGEVKLLKPDPAIFRLLLSKISHPAQNCLLIDDSIENIKSAHELGFATIHFQSPYQLEGQLHSLNVL